MSKDFYNHSFSDTLVAFSTRTEARDYWTSRLAARKADTGFPHSTGQRNEKGNATISCTIPADLAKKLNTVCGDDQSLRVLLMTNLVVQLQKFLNADTITIGTCGPGAGKAIPVMVTINRPITFRELLMQTRQEYLQAVEHHDYPVALLLNREDGESVDRLFGVALLVGEEGTHDLHTETDVAFAFNRNDGNISCNLTFSNSAFVARDIQVFFETFVALLSRCLSEPDVAISRIAPYTEETGKKMLVDFNHTTSLYPNVSIADVFEKCAAATPDKVALVHNGLQITYCELSIKTSAIANALKKRGVTTNTPVIVLQPTGADYIITILGILKAGGVYVPVDPEYPAQRIKYLIDDVGAGIVVTCAATPNQSDVLNTSRELSFISVETLANEGVANEEVLNVSGDLAYVLFTSGSTGNPKGVLISHRNVLRLVMNTNYISFSASTRVLQTGAITFDATTFEIWGSLLNGGTLFLIDKNDLLDPDRLAVKLSESDANTLWLTAPFFNQLVDHAGTDMFKRLDWLVVGGDTLSPAHINRVRNAHERVNIVNGYGPTENTTFSLTHDIQHAYDGPIPIGKPISNSTGFVFNEQLEPMPMLGWGTLYVGGDGVTRGYLNNPELTHAKLIRHTRAGNGILYRTDDVVRMLPDYTIEFNGRSDHQVKIRGYRVELGEIEAQMLRIPGVRNCVVTARRVGTSGDTKLCAYFVATPEVDGAQCKTFLTSALPAHMVPHHFIRLEEFPLTPHGKLDTKALPAPETAGSQPACALGRHENQMVQIWAGVLGIDVSELHAHAHFFELGGHSLRAIALLSSIQREFNVKITISQLFKNPRLEALTNLVRSAKGGSKADIKKAEHKEYYPLPSPQKRMYIIQQLDPTSTAYNIAGSATFNECLDRKRTADVFNQIIDRHESLRTGFFIKDGNVYQKIYPTVDFEIQHAVTDEGGLQGKIHDFIRPFDLSKPPLMRGMLLTVDNKRTVLLLDMHHIITDGISQDILLREFRQLISGAVSALPPVAWQYKDIAEWQQSAEYGKALIEEEAFWLRELSGELPLLDLPLDYERPRVKRYEGNTLKFALTQKQTSEVADFCERHDVTLHMFLMAAWSLTLSKYNTQPDLIMGTPVSGRSIAEMQEVTGMFVNTLPIRCTASPEYTFTEYLHAVKQKMLAALDHQHYPLEDLVEKLSVPRDTSRNPLFDAVFNLLHASADGLENYASELARGYELQRVAKFDVSLTAIDFKTEIQFSLEYAVSLFGEDTMRRMAESFKSIVAEVVAEPGVLLCDVSFLSETERHLLLESFNHYRLPLPAETSMNEIISRHAATSPTSVALVDSRGVIHYGELEDKANLLAAELIEKGVLPGSVVGVSMNNVKEVVVAMVGVLKAGAVFLPFDAQLPGERIRQMLELAGTKFIICQREHIQKFEPIASLIAIEDIMESGKHARTIALRHHLAYIIFTSGTTGIPNGVKVSHQSLINLCAWHQDFYSVTASDRATKYASLSFDATVWEIFPYLYAGASLYFIEQDARLDIRQINADLEANGVTIAFLPTQIGEKFTTLPNKSLKKLLLGGDKLKQVELSRNAYEIYNNYGPTENTVVTTACRVTRAMTNYPIGKPVANNKVYVLRSGRFELVPLGVPGELCVSGESLAAGYLDEETTRKSFVDNPFGERMYRTGDLVRWLPDGNLEFLGRINDQVKLRGYRIELAEIESQMMAVPGIEESVVLLRKGEDADDFLCGYYTARQALSTEQVRSALKARLPEYMVPAHLVCLDSMPLTHNGKIDKRALPAPQVTSVARYTAPATLLEQQLTGVWASVLALKAEKIGAHDNFFELGGNSMKIILLKERISETLQRQVPVVRLFEFTTIRAQASFISEGESMREAENKALEAMEKESLDVLNQTLISLNN